MLMSILNRWLTRFTLGVLCSAAAVPLALASNLTGEPIRVAMIEGLSGPFANTGEAAFRNLAWGAERINAAGGYLLHRWA